MVIKNTLMKLHIAPDRSVSDLQKDFNDVFPFLKIEFFPNKQRTSLVLHQILPATKRIADGQQEVTHGTIELRPDMKVKELENIFKEKFSLLTQVFRRSGNIWLETTMTDEWTLGQQNEHGREISTDNKKDNFRNNDYELNSEAD